MAKKKKSAHKQSRKEEFFVSVSDPFVLKSAILSGRKSILESMKLLQSLKEVRAKKAAEKEKLRKQVRHVYLTLTRIKNTMPKINIPSESEPVPEKKVTPRPEPKRSVPKTELQKIEDQLKDIESKISTLGVEQ